MLNKIFSRSHVGVRNWILQRLTAVILALYSTLFVALLIAQNPTQFGAWQALFSPMWMRLATLLFMLSLCVHAWLGVRDIFQDYVPSLKLRRALQWLAKIALLLYAAWAVKILWGF